MSSSSPTLKHTPQYSVESIDRYEKIFGRDFVSTGGLDTTRAFTAELGLAPGMRVLDVGCGIGGSAFHMAREYGVEVLGVDLLPQMLERAEQRAAAYGIQGVTFRLGDILELELDEAQFDLVYSRDAFLHIADKHQLFTRLFGLLRPGGTLFITDYGQGPAPRGAAFEAYRDASGYDLREPAEYGDLAAGAGFSDVRVSDLTAEFLPLLRREIALTQSLPESELATADRDYLVDRWEKKADFCERGDMRWYKIRATRPE